MQENFERLAATSSIKYSAGRVVSNQAVVTTLPGASAFAVFNSAGLTHFAFDIFGFFTPT